MAIRQGQDTIDPATTLPSRGGAIPEYGARLPRGKLTPNFPGPGTTVP
jgi:hypothetical protein